MSETPETTVAPAPVATPAPVQVAEATAAPAKALTAIQTIESEIGNFLKQRETAIANVHAVDGAIQASRFLLARLKHEAFKAEQEAKSIADAVVNEVKTVVTDVEAEAKKL